MSERGITVGVVNYNGATYLRDTLQAVGELGAEVSEVLLVDNGSTDGGIQLVRESFPHVRLIELGENRGPGAARNVIAREASSDRILIIDNDVAPLPGCVEALSAALDSHPRAVIAMPVVRFASAPETVQFAGAEAHFLGTMVLRCAGHAVGSLDGNTHKVGSLVSACFLLERRRLGIQPLFDETYFFYFEDHELGLRCSLLGFELLAVPGAHCLHGAGTVGISVRQTGRFTPTRVRYTIRNRWHTMLKLYQWRTLLRFGPALAAFELFQFAGAIRKGWLGHWLWAAGSVASLLPDVLRRRRLFARARRRGDLELLVSGPFPFNPAMRMAGAERASRRALDAIAQLNWRLSGPRRRETEHSAEWHR